MLTFTVYRGDQIVQELDLEGDEITIGRNVANQIVLPDEGKGISRDHATLRNEGGRYVLYDRNSKIGTVVDGKKIKRVVLEPGQEFVIGPYRLVFNIADPSSAGLRPTMALPLPPPAPVEVPREGTERRTASQTHSKQPTVRSAALGAKVTDAMAWLTRQPPSVVYTAGAVVLVAFGAYLLWRLWLWSPAPTQLQTAQVAVVSTTTTTSIEPVSLITPAEIAAVQTALDDVEATITPANSRQRIDPSRYAAAAAAYEQVIKERIQPLLDKDPNHREVNELLVRAQDGRQNARDGEARSSGKPMTSVVTSIPVAVSDSTGVQRRADESDAAYNDRNSNAKAEHEKAKALLAKGDVLVAYKALIALGDREPSLVGINASIKNAEVALQRERQEAVAQGQKGNDAGYAAAGKRQFESAVPALTVAWKALNRAADLGAPGIDSLVAYNSDLRLHTAAEIMKLANTYANDEQSLGRARTHFGWVIQLLPASHPLYKEAESALKKLGS